MISHIPFIFILLLLSLYCIAINDAIIIALVSQYYNFTMAKVEPILLTEKPMFAELCIGNQSSNKFKNEVDDFKMLMEMGLPCNKLPVEEKLFWLRSQIIGNDVEFTSPFGRQKLVYADHTASGRSLHYIENFIINHILPFYGIDIIMYNFDYIYVRSSISFLDLLWLLTCSSQTIKMLCSNLKN